MPSPDRRLISRPQLVVAAEQERHDRAQARGLTAFFAALVGGGGLALVIQFSALLQGHDTLRGVSECFVFLGPLLASFVILCRVPPPPFESLVDPRRDLEKKERQWRRAVVGQVFMFALFVIENLWLWPRVARMHNWLFAAISLAPAILMVLIAINTLYVGPGWLSSDLRAVLDDEVTRNFRARAQRVGYLLMLVIVLGFAVLARLDARSAAHYLPLGLAAGVALQVLYFVYLDWQASRGG
jgi:hypothetical protein